MKKILSPAFFERNTLDVARQLLGTFLVRQRGGRCTAYMIMEVEAYDGPLDRASHAHRGRTERNAPMFGAAGVWYVYLVYGMHWMLNIVTGPVDYPAAILIRAVMAESGRVISGPGRVTNALHLSGRYTARAARRNTGLWIEDRGIRIPDHAIVRGPRVGVAYAGAWAKKPYRFMLAESFSTML